MCIRDRPNPKRLRDWLSVPKSNGYESLHTTVMGPEGKCPAYVVYDPVMVSTSGKNLMTDEAIEEIKKELLPLVTLITPNIDEAKVLQVKVFTTFKTCRPPPKC